MGFPRSSGWKARRFKVISVWFCVGNNFEEVSNLEEKGEKSAKGRTCVCMCALAERVEKGRRFSRGCQQKRGRRERGEEEGVRANVYVNFSFCTRIHSRAGAGPVRG